MIKVVSWSPAHAWTGCPASFTRDMNRWIMAEFEG
jgi:hypothetical protein